MTPTDHASLVEQPASPIRENWLGMVFLAVLLIASAVTATVVGYKVKSADRQRKADLLSAYESLGGSFERSLTLGQTLYSPSLTDEQKIFVTTYEVNERARKLGLYPVVEKTDPQVLDVAQGGLIAIGAKEGGLTLKDTLIAYRELPTKPNTLNPAAARFARQYDRYLARDTEVKLYKYFVDNRAAIEPKR